jgi:hypothetical protein
VLTAFFNTLKNQQVKRPVKGKAHPGTTLVEILIAMALMGFVMLSISNFLVKSNAMSASLSMRFKEANEIHTLIQDIQADLNRGAYISDNSFDKRLEYTTYDPNTLLAVKKVFTLVPVSGSTAPYYLQLSVDGAAAGSPYSVSDYTKYQISGTPRFLYAHASNDCWDYVDDNANGVLGSGDSTINLVAACSASAYGGVTDTSKTPSKSSKVVLANFNFTTANGTPEALRTLPSYIFIAAPPGLVRSQVAAVAPAVKDPPLVQSFSFDNAVNPLWPASFNVRGITWDTVHERLILGTDALGKLYQTERDGVFINTPLALANAVATPRGVAVEDDGQTLDVLYFDGSTNDYYYQYNLSATPPLSPTVGPTGFSPASSAQGNRWHMAYDSNTKNMYLGTYDTSDTTYKIVEYYNGSSSTPGTRTGTTLNTNYWVLPAAFASGAQIGGLVIDNKTGDFIIARNLVYASGGSNWIDIYRITRAGVSSYFSINLTDLGSTATGTAGVFGMAYAPNLNRLFLSDNVSKKIFEVSPPQVITSR